MVYFQTKNPILDKLWRAFDWKMLIYFMAIRNTFYGHLGYFLTILYILCSFGTFGVHLVHFSGFGIMYGEKSGNPVLHICMILIKYFG
jgi:hypothetical protein